MTTRRRLLPLVGALVAAFGLAGCEQPTPIVTVQSGTSVVVSEAQAWCFGERPGEECRDEQGAVPAGKLTATPGQLVSIDVAKEVAERGWVVEQAVAGSPQQSGAYDPRDDHYFTITMPPAAVTLTIRALDGKKAEDGTYDPTQITGSWLFVVEPRD